MRNRVNGTGTQMGHSGLSLNGKEFCMTLYLVKWERFRFAVGTGDNMAALRGSIGAASLLGTSGHFWSSGCSFHFLFFGGDEGTKRGT